MTDPSNAFCHSFYSSIGLACEGAVSGEMPCIQRGVNDIFPSHSWSNPSKPPGSLLSPSWAQQLEGETGISFNTNDYLSCAHLLFFQLLKLFLMRMPPRSRSQCELAKGLLEHIFQVVSQGEGCSLGNTPEQEDARQTLILWNPALPRSLGRSDIHPICIVSRFHAAKAHGSFLVL